MNQMPFRNVLTSAADSSKDLLVRQIDERAHALGAAITQTAADLHEIGELLRGSPTLSSAAGLTDWTASYIQTAGTYLQDGDSSRFFTDIETVGRERPFVVTAAVTVLGFAAARVIKSSSARRLRSQAAGDTLDHDAAAFLQ